MSEIFGIILIALSSVTILIVLMMLLSRKKKTKPEISEAVKRETDVDHNVAVAEQHFYKQCRNCGGDVPKAENICMHCNQIP